MAETSCTEATASGPRIPVLRNLPMYAFLNIYMAEVERPVNDCPTHTMATQASGNDQQ